MVLATKTKAKQTILWVTLQCVVMWWLTWEPVWEWIVVSIPDPLQRYASEINFTHTHFDTLHWGQVTS